MEILKTVLQKEKKNTYSCNKRILPHACIFSSRGSFF